jgi:hypothetical protein
MIENLDDAELLRILEFMKKRTGDCIRSPEGREIMSKTNALLKNGLFLHLIRKIRETIIAISSGNSTSAIPSTLQTVRLQTEVLFFIAYQSQVEEDEAAGLLGLIKFISSIVACPPEKRPKMSNSQVQQNFPNHTGFLVQPDKVADISGTADTEFDWLPPVYSLLVILQLTHVGALQQTTYLLSRHVDYDSPQFRNCRNIEDVIEVGNMLPQIVGSRCGMDAGLGNAFHQPQHSGAGGQKIPKEQEKEDAEAPWLCDGAKGFACLCFAVLRQPEVDIDHAPASDVEWFLLEACQMRAYSYIRLCMLPVLQAAYLHDKETSLFYVVILCELLENLSKIFCMTHYKKMQAHNENDFPYKFFPPTDRFYDENEDFYLSALQSNMDDNDLGGNGTQQQRLRTLAPAVDSLEDVMSLFTAMLALRPEFAHTFWPTTQSHDIQHQQQQHHLQQQSTEHHDIVDHYYHPFVMKAVDASFHHPSLMIPAIRFVGALSNSPLGRTAYAGYLFVLDSRHRRFGWDHFFDSMEKIALQLGASLTVSGQQQNQQPPYLGVAGGNRDGTLGRGSVGLMSTNASNALVPVIQALSEKDAEGLVAIMQLLTAVAVHPDVAQLLHDAYHPVPRLFALLSCSLPLVLKGAILKALSVFASGSATICEEIWELIEAHRLLPIVTSGFAGTTSGGPPSGLGGYQQQQHTQYAQSVPQQQQRRGGANHNARGLRVELEEVESREGCYPITEGFLQLLKALLSHGTPDNRLGLGYRRPGLMVYLDYVIDDVLLRAGERYYAPSNWPSAVAQRWRISSYCLDILCVLLQNYPINAIAGNTLPIAENEVQKLDSFTLKEVVADFRDATLEYTVEGFAAAQRYSRPKTAAFLVMHLLLSKSRLFENLGMLLAECNADSIDAAFNDHCLSEVGAAVDLLQLQRQQLHPGEVAKKTSDTFDFDDYPARPNFGFHRNDSSTFAFSSGMAGAAREMEAEAPELLDLTNLGHETHLCDSVFWQERTLSGIVGLLYECSLREDKFMSFIRSSGASQLTITRSSGDQGRVSVVPVIVHDLSELLSCGNREDVVPLASIAQVVPMHVRSCPCLPAVNVLAVRLLEHVALHLPAPQLIAALTLPTQNEQFRRQQQRFRREDKFIALQPDSGIVMAYLVKGCAAAIKLGVDVSAEQNDGSLHYDVMCQGGAPYPAFYSLSKAYTRLVSKPNLYLSMIHADSGADAAQVDAEYIRALQLGGSIREAVIHMLLTTLTPQTACLAHQMLGLSLHSVSATTGSRGHIDVNHAMSECCLEAVLSILAPDSCALGTSFIQQFPLQASDCFELIYRLCASPLTSQATLQYLGSHSVDFFRVQLTLILYLLHLSDKELLEGASDADISVATGGNGEGNSQGSGVNPTFVVLESIKTALCSAAAWLLKSCTLYIRHIDLLRVHRRSEIDCSLLSEQCCALVKLLFGNCSELSFARERGSNTMVLEKLLHCACTFPMNAAGNEDPSSTSLTEILKCRDAAAVLHSYGKAGSGWGDFNQFLRADATFASSLSYKTIDLRTFSALLKTLPMSRPTFQSSQSSYARKSVESGNEGLTPEAIKGALDGAVLANIFQKHLSTKIHLCICWCQLVSVSLSSAKSLEFLQRIFGEEDQAASVAAFKGGFSSADGSTGLGGRTSIPASGQSASSVAQVIFEQLLVPTSNALLACRSSALQHLQVLPLVVSVVPEQLAKCLLSIIACLTVSSRPHNHLLGNLPMLLLPEQHTRLLQIIIQLLLSKVPNSITEQSFPSQQRNGVTVFTASALPTVSFQGMVAVALTRVLKFGGHKAGPNNADSGLSGEEQASFSGSHGSEKKDPEQVLQRQRHQQSQEAAVFAECAAEYRNINVVREVHCF